MDPFVDLAKKTIFAFVQEGRILDVPQNLPENMLKKRAGTFVTLSKKSTKQLRGCIGTFNPTCENIASEIIQNAISASTRDPRFPPLASTELHDLEIKIDILTHPEKTTKKQLNPKKYGLIVKHKSGRMGLLLPDILSVKTVDQQIAICKQKALIGEEEPVELFKFCVERHEEK